jgi:hypothetical protein
MITNFEGVKLKHPEMKDYEVDSQALIHSIAHGLDLKDLSGWGSVEYYKLSEPGALYLGRGANGDLGVAGIGTSKKDCMGIVWSSETHELERSLRLAGFPYFLFKVKENRLVRIQDGKLEKMGRFDLNYQTLSKPPSNQWSTRSQEGDGWTTRNPTLSNPRYGINITTMTSVPPSYASLPDFAKHWEPGMILDEGKDGYRKDYPTYVNYYVSYGWAPDHNLLTKDRGTSWKALDHTRPPVDGGMLALPGPAGSLAVPIDSIVKPAEDHLPSARQRYMHCEACETVLPLVYKEEDDGLFYFSRISKYLCRTCRQDWGIQTGEVTP